MELSRPADLGRKLQSMAHQATLPDGRLRGRLQRFVRRNIAAYVPVSFRLPNSYLERFLLYSLDGNINPLLPLIVQPWTIPLR